MTKAIMIRVEPENFEVWLGEHMAHTEARKGYGISDGPFYRDVSNEKAVLVHLETDNLPRALEWFQTPSSAKPLYGPR